MYMANVAAHHVTFHLVTKYTSNSNHLLSLYTLLTIPAYSYNHVIA